LKEALAGEQVALIENEFGEIAVDGGFLEEAGVQIREMNSGCICCSLVGDFVTALKEVIDTYHPDRIIIEPTGVEGLEFLGVFSSPHLYSLVYNGAYMVPNTIIALVIAALLLKPMGKYFAGNDLQ
jgi:hypothetical protein